MPKGLFLWQSEAGKYLKFRGPLKRAIKILKSELNKLDQYSSQTWNTARKCYEFLSLPANIKLFSEYDAKTLALDSKSREIRRSFDETMQIKNEYDGLKG
jgi:hypothetical protein